jgi:hypothetical protein
MDEYPLFLPPKHLATRQPYEWSRAEADEYRLWLTSSIDERVATLLKFLGLSTVLRTEDAGEFLSSVGCKASEILMEDDFSEEGARGRRLTNRGYALAADIGLLVASILLKVCKDIHWTTLRKPKSELSYNLPVLVGFMNNYLDPVGGSTAEASAILRGHRDADAWRNMLVFWRNLAL